MPTQLVTLTGGERLEFWATATAATPASFCIKDQSGNTLWAIPQLVPHFQHYCYEHAPDAQPEVVIEWDLKTTEFGYAYSYQPEEVAYEGITLWQFGDAQIAQFAGRQLNEKLACETTRPTIHFSPPQFWMNDPNGFCWHNDRWHLFYQFHPCSCEWGPMHWGHATSTDLINWVHQPVHLHPVQNLYRLGASGGAFSGSAVSDHNGELHLCYTERLPCYDTDNGIREVQRFAAGTLPGATTPASQTVIDERPQGASQHFRDPKIWWDTDAGAYRLVLGSAIDGNAAVLLYGSANLTNWDYLGELYRVPQEFHDHGAISVECPDFFYLDGKWVLLFSLFGYCDPVSGRKNRCFVLIGDFVNNQFQPANPIPQELDFGTDFYAIQTCAEDERRLALAWVHNWSEEHDARAKEYAATAGYCGEQSLPRELSLTTDKQQLRMLPSTELDQVCPPVPLEPTNGNYVLTDTPLEIVLTAITSDCLIEASTAGEVIFAVSYTNEELAIKLPLDDCTTNLSKLTDLRVFHDRGIIEVFANNGTCCGTRRYVTAGNWPQRLSISGDAKITVYTRNRQN